MSSLLSCARCARPLAAGGAGGLCPTCQAASTATRSRPGGAATREFEQRVLGLAGAFPDTADAPPGTPAALPPAPWGYDLLEPLGEGGMGDVYLARELAADRLVAMKFLRSPGNPAAVDRFLVEVQSLARLDHPHIVRVYATDFFRADPYFTMEYARGGTLAERVKSRGPLAADEAARVVAVVARAVAAAHAADVLHRDIKPGNILLAEDGTPKVSDFGLAKRTDRDDGLTVATGPLGTPGFMPPEQVSSRYGGVGPASDVYGLGATLYHLLTGRAPFVGDTPAEVVAQVETTLPDLPRSIRPDVPPGLEAVVVKCLEKKPADRYGSAAALADDLDRFLAGEMPEAPEQTRWRRVKRWAVRNRAPLAGAAAAVLVGVGLMAAGAALTSGPEPERIEPPPTPPDPLEEIRKELAAGRRVELVGKNGLPRWRQWRVNAVVLRESPLPEEGCSFEAGNLSLLDLIPDPGIDRYRLIIELRHLAGQGGQPEAKRGSGRVGMYFGADGGTLVGNQKFHPMFTVWFRDSAPKNPPPGQPPNETRAVFDAALVVEQPNFNPADHTKGIASVAFAAAEHLPGLWRAVVIDVTPESLLVQWRTAKGELEPFRQPGPWPRHWTGDQTRALHGQLQTLLDQVAKQPGTVLRPWSPRSAVGVFASFATVGFRSVVIEPLTNP